MKYLLLLVSSLLSAPVFGQMMTSDRVWFEALPTDEQVIINEYARAVIHGDRDLAEEHLDYFKDLPVRKRINIDRVLLGMVSDTFIYQYQPLLKIKDESFIQYQREAVKEKILAWLDLLAKDRYFFFRSELYPFYLSQIPEVQRKMLRMAAAEVRGCPIRFIDYASIADEQAFFKQMAPDEQKRVERMILEMNGKQGYPDTATALRDADEQFYYGIDEFKKFWMNSYIAGQVLNLSTDMLVYQEDGETGGPLARQKEQEVEKKEEQEDDDSEEAASKESKEKEAPKGNRTAEKEKQEKQEGVQRKETKDDSLAPKPKPSLEDLSNIENYQVDEADIVADSLAPIQTNESQIERSRYLWYEKGLTMKELYQNKRALLFTLETGGLLENKLDTSAQIDNLVQELKNNPSMYILVEGHTDNSWEEEEAMEVAYSTAQDFESYMVDHFGLKETRIKLISWGQNKPKMPNVTSQFREMNNRLDIYVELQ